MNVSYMRREPNMNDMYSALLPQYEKLATLNFDPMLDTCLRFRFAHTTEELVIPLDGALEYDMLHVEDTYEHTFAFFAHSDLIEVPDDVQMFGYFKECRIRPSGGAVKPVKEHFDYASGECVWFVGDYIEITSNVDAALPSDCPECRIWTQSDENGKAISVFITFDLIS